MDGKKSYVYIMARGRNSTFYVGVTSDLARRVWEYKNKITGGFTAKYELKTLGYYEVFNDAENAIKHEKQIKKWN